MTTAPPPDGLSFFGPVISRVPSAEDSLRLWDAVITLAGFPGFAEMKRSLREMPQLNILGGISDAPIQRTGRVDTGEVTSRATNTSDSEGRRGVARSHAAN